MSIRRRHIKFVWGGPESIKGRWYFRLIGFYSRREGTHDDGLAINVSGLLAWLAALAVAAWLGGAAALVWIWQRNPYSQLTYSDALLYPVRRDQIHEKHGQALIAQGTDALHAKRWNEAMTCLRQGLVLYPRDMRARLSLAQFYVATNQRSVALRLLQEGLTEQFPGRAYLAGLFGVAQPAEDFAIVVQTAELYLLKLQGAGHLVDRRWLLGQEFAAQMGARQFAEALALAEAQEPGDTASEQRVLALLELHRPGDALRLLAEWRARPGADQATVARLSVRAFREAGQFDEMEQALATMRAQAPTDPRVLVYGVVQQALASRDPQAKAALEDYLFRFGGSPQNLQLIAAPLAEIGNLPLLERCAAAASERGYAAQPFHLLLVQASVKRGEWEAAARTFAQMKPVAGNAAAQDQLWRDWMQRLLDAVRAPGDGTSLKLVDFLRSRPWSVNIFQTTVEALRRAKRLESARDVLGLARANFPASAWVEKQATEVALELAAQAPAPASAIAARGTLPAQKLFFQQLEDCINGGQWAAAGQLIRDARNAQPAPNWVSSRDSDLRLAEMRVAQALGEPSRMLAAAEIYLNGDAERSRTALDFARAFYAKGDQSSAIALVNLMLRRSPDDEAARKLMAEWRPRPAQRKSAEPKPED